MFTRAAIRVLCPFPTAVCNYDNNGRVGSKSPVNTVASYTVTPASRRLDTPLSWFTSATRGGRHTVNVTSALSRVVVTYRATGKKSYVKRPAALARYLSLQPLAPTQRQRGFPLCAKQLPVQFHLHALKWANRPSKSAQSPLTLHGCASESRLPRFLRHPCVSVVCLFVVFSSYRTPHTL